MRVEGCSNTSATLFPSSARDPSRSRFSSRARSTSWFSSSFVSSAPVRKCRVNANPQLEPLPRSRLPARPGSADPALAAPPRDRARRHARAGESPAAARVRAAARPLASGTSRCSRRRRRDGSARSRGAPARAPRSSRTSRNLAARRAVAAGRPQPRPARVERRRLEPDARAPSRAGSPRRAACGWPSARSGAGCSGRGWSCPRAASAWRTCTRARDVPRRRPLRCCARPSRRSSGRAATRSCSAETSTSARGGTRSPSCCCASASAWASPQAPRRIDHLLARGLEVVERPRRLEPAERELTEPGGRRIRLSDHAPVAARFGLP